MNDISNVQNEILLVGCFYKNPDLYVEYGKFIKSKYDLSDEVSKFLYDNFETYYKTFSQTIDESKVNTFMSQETERFKQYRKYGGYKTIKTWVDLCDLSDFKNYLEVVKKYSLLREFENKGYNVKKIMEHKKFNVMKANDIYKIIRSGADKIGTIILSNENSIVANKEVKSAVRNWLIAPQFGANIPFDLINEMFRGLRLGKLICLGFLSNEGKTRIATYLASFVAFVNGEKVCFLANETDEDDFKACLITTIINNEEFNSLHGIKLQKKERETVLGQYFDDKGTLLERLEDEDGNFIETEDEYETRVYNSSQQYRDIIAIAEWMESRYEETIHFKFMREYSDEDIEFEIRKHNLVHGVKYFFYDTLKGWKGDEWSALKQTTTKLSALMIELKAFCWCDIQLTDDTAFTDIFQMSSNNIANAKQMKHVLDHLIIGKRLDKEDYHKYKVVLTDTNWVSEPQEANLNLDKTYYALKVDKNRGGSKDKISLLCVDLNLNSWKEVGYLIKNNTKNK